ncbi:WD40 repeat domain-containing protein [Allokutzneria sp. NRRL B-24872]|uniref:WD40 repeat domain-containing protein n=1 Tax=Allokutzneria sp. NRRL B-24872 TaxID=1137961 RepID=UPI000A3B4C90|nr:hypothetical protein [Allokutzneria sp. NRRL B-24872]
MIDVLQIATGKPVVGVVFSPDGRFLAAVAGRRLHLWDAIGRRPLVPERRPASARKRRRTPQPPHVAWVNCAAFSPDSALVAVGGSYEFYDHERGILHDGAPVNAVSLIDVRSGSPDGLPFIAGHGEEITSVAFSVDGTQLCATDEDGITRLWDIATRQLVDAPPPPLLASTTRSPDGRVQAEARDDGTVRLRG